MRVDRFMEAFVIRSPRTFRHIFWQGLLLLSATTAHALELPLPAENDTVVGRNIIIKARYEDTLAMIAQEYGVGYRELLQANPEVDPWLPGAGTDVTIPGRFVLPAGPREGIVINLPEYRLYYYPPNTNTVVTFPIGIGRDEWSTPLFQSRVVTAIENPSWTPTESIRKEHLEAGDELPRVVPPGPNNPLGHLAIQLARPGYFIHGTNQPFGVGQRVSHGCIRLYPADIEALVRLARRDTPVRVVDQPIKVGRLGKELFLESHPRLDGTLDLTGMVRVLVDQTATDDPQSRVAGVDWQRAELIVREGRGLPEAISATL